MHKSLNISALVGVAAAFALTPAVTAAQDNTEPEAAETTAAMTPEQEAMMQAWPADQQAAFKLWPAETQEYYWSLSAARQKMFWALSDSDKVALSTMAEPQRESTWAQIESRLMSPQA
ncbi:MAG: hypothetical protein NWP98_03090 [Erythrobacter sp.]|nr:hypothetical protein [Erythrobacter sp.]